MCDKECKDTEEMGHDITEEARKMLEAGNGLGAIALLTQAIAQGDGRRETLLLRARVFAAMGCAKEAEEDTDQCLSDREDEDACLLKAALRLGQDDTDAAITYYNKVKEKNPQNAEACLGLSRTYAASHRLDLALAAMDEALERLPDFAEGYKERGRIKFLLHDQAGAMEDLKRALALSPEAAKEVEGHFTNLPTPDQMQ